MSSVVIAGNTSGSVTLSAPDVAGTTTLTLPSTSGNILTSGTAVTVAQGGTGATSLTANNVILGNGTSAVQVVAPSTSGNVLTSNGTTWTSAAAPNPYTAQNQATSGYITLVGGLKINWVTTSTTAATSGTIAVTWNSAFTTCYGAVVCQSLATDSGEVGINKSTTGGTLDFYGFSSSTKSFTVIGIGI